MWNIGRQMVNILGASFGHSERFEAEYHCYPVSFAGKDEIEKGNKILLPQSALHTLAQMNISWPMLFEMTNPLKGRMTHSGVLEFIAEEGTCYMPYWMMQNLLLKEGDIVKVSNISLPKGHYVKLQPVTKDFLDISNPKAVLENALRNYATLTVGDNIVIQYLDKNYEIEIVDLKPSKACSIIETDVEVDFQPPKDYIENPDAELPVKEGKQTITTLFSGTGNRLDGKSRIDITYDSPLDYRNESLTNIKAGLKVDCTNAETEFDESPWRKRLPGGVRRYNSNYEDLIRAGKIPGIVGTIKKADSLGGNDKNSSCPSDFKMFAGNGNFLQ